MASDDLTQKTFEEILREPTPNAHPAHGKGASNEIHGRVVLERLGNGVRVTGQDSNQQLLWGMVASRSMIEQPHCAVAVYGRLREIINEALVAEYLPSLPQTDVVAAAKQSLADLRDLIGMLTQKLTVKRETEPTIRRAIVIHRAISDAMCMIRQETATVTQGRESPDIE